MNITLEATVCTVENDNIINFIFTNKEHLESWCIGQTISSENVNPNVGQKIKIHGRWVNNAFEPKARVFFYATSIENCGV
jgi:hypothetical protein